MSGAPVLRDIAFTARQLAGSGPDGFKRLQAYPQTRSRWPVGLQTDVCIDGFPRSGSSLAVRAFREWNPGLSIAHHAHLPGQLLLATGVSAPAVVLVRDPVESVSSLLLYVEGKLHPAVVLWAYARFYERLASHRHVLAACRFEELVADPKVLVEALNVRFGTGFCADTPDQPTRRRWERELDAEASAAGLGLPQQATPARSRRKQAYREAVGAHPRLARAEAAHRLWAETASSLRDR